MKEKFLTFLIYIFTFATLILVIIFQQNLSKIALIAGIGGTIIGLLTILKKSNYGYIIFSPATSLLTSAILYKTNILDRYDCVTLMICMSILILMIITLIISILGYKKVQQIYDLVIEAKVSDLVKNPNTKKEYYQVIYEYVIKDNLYIVGTPDYINKFIPRIGEQTTIRVNSKDYTDVFFDKRPLDKLYDNGLVIGLIIVTSIIIISLFI